MGDNRVANGVQGGDAESGERIWHFKGVKPEPWDRDFPSPPALLTVKHGGQKVDAVAQTTKQGFVYLFERASGKPLFPIEYQKYPPSTVPGEAAPPDQPLPARPAPYSRQLLTEETLTNRTPDDHQW